MYAVVPGTASNPITWQGAEYNSQTGLYRMPNGTFYDPKSGQWGAFELAARLSQVHADRDAFRLGLADPTASASNAHAYTLGLNWYLNRAVKAQFNYERTVFDRSIKFGSDKRDHEDVFLTELQLAF